MKNVKRDGPPVVFLTGGLHSGKSTLAEALVHRLRGESMRVAGMIARGVWENGIRSAFELIDLSDGRVTPLCRRVPDSAAPDGVPFVFNEDGIAAGIKALSPERCCGADCVIVDEVGVLELQGRGWAARLDGLLAIEGLPQIWVVRDVCVEPVCRKWGISPVAVVATGQADAVNRLLDAVKERSLRKHA